MARVGLVTRRPQQPRQYPRVARVNEVVLEVLADELKRLSDPRLGFVTLTGAEVTADLRIANVFYSVMGDTEQHSDTADALKSASPRLRQVLGRQVKLRYLPELRFREDHGVVQGLRIEEVIRGLHEGDRP